MDELNESPVAEAQALDAQAGGSPEVRASRSTSIRVGVFAVVAASVLAGLYELGQRPRAQAQLELTRTLHEVQEALPAVNVMRPAFGSAQTELELPGETAAFYETTICARVNGYLATWTHDIGDQVKKGELLATIDTPELDQQLAEARARVGALQADLQLAEAQLEFAKITAERWESAAPNGAVSKQERDAKNAEYKTAQAKHAAAKAQLALGEATVKRLEAEESFKNVVAPFDGVITQRKIDIGSLITAGSTSSTSPLFAIVQANQLRVYVRVPQTAAPEITVGMAARVTTRELPGQVFSGTVDRTAGAVDQASRTLKVEVLVPNPKLALLPGMYARVAFETARAHPPLLVQAGALDLRPEGPTVAVVDAEDRVHFRKIKVAQDLGDAIEVADGLRPDDWVGLNVSDDIADGERVQPVRVESPSAIAPNGPAGPRLADMAHQSNALAEIR